MSERRPEKSYYPIYLDLHGKKCVVVGGGAVALRKVSVLLEHSAGLTVISPRLCGGLRRLVEQGQIDAVQRVYREGDLKGAALAIVATSSSKINRQAAAEAKREKALVNVVDDPLLSDFIVPALVRRGDLSIAVSTGGKSPALARKIRTKLQREFGREYARLTLLVNQSRSDIKKEGVRPGSKSWQDALDIDALLELIRSGKTRQARQLLLSRLTGTAAESALRKR